MRRLAAAQLREVEHERAVAELRDRLADRARDVGTQRLDVGFDLGDPRDPSRDVVPAAIADERPQRRQRAREDGGDDRGVRLDAREARRARDLRVGAVDARGRVAQRGERRGGLIGDRQVERGELRDVRRRAGIEPRERARLIVEARGRPIGAALAHRARVELRLDERRQRCAALGRELQPIERDREQLRRGRLEIEQQAQRVGEIDVRELAEHRLAGQAAVEQARQHRASQQRAARVGVEPQHGARELREEHARQPRIDGADQHHHVVVALLQRRAARGAVAVDEPREHRRELRRFVDDDREIGERDRIVGGRRRVDADPSLVGRIEMLRRSAGDRGRLPHALAIDERPHGLGGRADVEHFGPRRLARHDRRDARVEQQLREARRRLRRPRGGGERRAEVRPVADRHAALDFDRRNAHAVQRPRDFLLDDRVAADDLFADDDRARRDAEREGTVDVQLHERAMARVDRVGAHRAGGRVRVKLAGRAAEQLQEIDDRRGAGVRRGGCRLVRCPANFVIGLPDRVCHGRYQRRPPIAAGPSGSTTWRPWTEGWMRPRRQAGGSGAAGTGRLGKSQT